MRSWDRRNKNDMLWLIEKQLGKQHFETRNKTCKIVTSDEEDDDDDEYNNNNNNNKCCYCDFKRLCVGSSLKFTF
jgi:hypothetical protein